MRCVGDETARCLSSVNICAATCFETNHRVADIEHGFGLRVWFPIIFSTQTPLLSTRPFHFRHKSRYVRLDCFIFDTKAVTFHSTVTFDMNRFMLNRVEDASGQLFLVVVSTRSHFFLKWTLTPHSQEERCQEGPGAPRPRIDPRIDPRIVPIRCSPSGRSNVGVNARVDQDGIKGWPWSPGIERRSANSQTNFKTKNTMLR